MEKREKPLKTFMIVFFLFMFFGILGAVLLRNYNMENSPELFVEEVELTSRENFPQIVNAPSRSIFLGEVFSFSPTVVPLDESVKLSLLGAPEWLVLDEDVVRGVPAEVGEFSFVLRVEKDGRYIDQEFFLIVSDNLDE